MSLLKIFKNILIKLYHNKWVNKSGKYAFALVSKTYYDDDKALGWAK